MRRSPHEPARAPLQPRRGLALERVLGAAGGGRARTRALTPARARRLCAGRRMSLLELPSNRDEAWRWSDLSALPEIVARAPAREWDLSDVSWLDCALEGPRLLFVDGRLE